MTCMVQGKFPAPQTGGGGHGPPPGINFSPATNISQSDEASQAWCPMSILLVIIKLLLCPGYV